MAHKLPGEKKPMTGSTEPIADAQLSRELKEQFISFLQQHSPGQFSTTLRRILLEYMIREIDGGMETGFARFLRALNDLFDLLDTAAKETMHWKA